MRNSYLILGVLALALLFGTAVTVLHPPPTSKSLTLSSSFLGYTNDGTGTRLAVFQISNASPQTIEWAYGCEIEERDETGWSRKGQSVILTNVVYHGRLLRGFENQIWKIRAPSAPGQWRLCIDYFPHEKRFQQLSRDVRLGLQRLGLPVKVSKPVCSVFHTEEVSP